MLAAEAQRLNEDHAEKRDPAAEEDAEDEGQRGRRLGLLLHAAGVGAKRPERGAVDLASLDAGHTEDAPIKDQHHHRQEHELDHEERDDEVAREHLVEDALTGTVRPRVPEEALHGYNGRVGP